MAETFSQAWVESVCTGVPEGAEQVYIRVRVGESRTRLDTPKEGENLAYLTPPLSPGVVSAVVANFRKRFRGRLWLDAVAKNSSASFVKLVELPSELAALTELDTPPGTGSEATYAAMLKGTLRVVVELAMSHKDQAARMGDLCEDLGGQLVELTDKLTSTREELAQARAATTKGTTGVAGVATNAMDKLVDRVLDPNAGRSANGKVDFGKLQTWAENLSDADFAAFSEQAADVIGKVNAKRASKAGATT